MTDRWALYLDVEGFGAKWNQTDMLAFRGINTLMESIYSIGSRHFNETPLRLFAYQFGDAFLVASDFPEPVLDRAALVGVALLRQMLMSGELAKCTLDEGETADVANCYPACVRAGNNDGRVDMGAGLMTVTSIMGSALVRTASLQKRAKGPLFLLRSEKAPRLSSSYALTPVMDGVLSLDWLRGDPPGMEELASASGLSRSSEAERIAKLRNYLSENPGLSQQWKENATRYLRLHDG